MSGRLPRGFPPLAPFLCWALLAPLPANAAGRDVAIIVDTSGSMESSDVPRYTMQLSQIIADLLADDDRLTVIKLGGGGCGAGVNAGLARRLDPSDRGRFKSELDAMIRYSGGNAFAAPIRTAIATLGDDPARPRMLLILADSGGLGGCDAQLNPELRALHDSGATVAAVNLGSTAGAFDTNPAFDFTTAALDAQKLVEAVALVYQRFLGAKQVQTGEVVDRIEVEIAPYVEEAFLVVAADGPVAGVEIDAGHPEAAAIDRDHRGGGETRGLHGRVRGYRIVRLERPAAGRWTFRLPGLQDRAGWMLLQDSALEVRLVSTPTLARGASTPIEAEVVDRVTGQRVTDPAALAELDVAVDVEGRRVRLTDDGQGADREAGDGVLTGTVTFEETGRHRLPLHLGSDLLDRTRSIEVEVIPAKWDVRVTTPARAEVGVPVRLAVALAAVGDAASLAAPEGFDVLTGGGSMNLGDDGRNGDETAGDRIYSTLWTPTDMGTMHLEYLPRGGVGAAPANAALEIVGGIRFGPPVPLELGETGGKSELYGDLDLSPAEVHGKMEVRISSDFEATRSVLEIDLGRGWTVLGGQPLAAELTADGPDGFPVRLRVGRCPEACRRDAGFAVRVAATAADGSARELAVPLALAIVPDAWWICWWPVLAGVAGLIVAAFGVYGFVSPSRFAPRLGVVLSPEEDLEEGFFHPIRGQRGSGAGFYRDARIFVTADHRLSSRPAGALARLRAHGQQVRIQPAGATLWRRNADGEWEKLPLDETPARYGVLYRNDLRTLYFAIRNR